MAEIAQNGDDQFSPAAFLAEGCCRLIERCQGLETALSENCAALKDQTSRKEVAFRRLAEVRAELKDQTERKEVAFLRLEEVRAELKDETGRKEVALRALGELRARCARLQAEYDKLAKSKLGRLTLWYWRRKDRRKAVVEMRKK